MKGVINDMTQINQRYFNNEARLNAVRYIINFCCKVFKIGDTVSTSELVFIVHVNNSHYICYGKINGLYYSFDNMLNHPKCIKF